MIVIHPVINMGVYFMNVYHTFKNIKKIEEIMGGSWRVNHLVPSSSSKISNNLLFYFIVSIYLN